VSECRETAGGEKRDVKSVASWPAVRCKPGEFPMPNGNDGEVKGKSWCRESWRMCVCVCVCAGAHVRVIRDGDWDHGRARGVRCSHDQ